MYLTGSMLSKRSQFPKLHAVRHSRKDKAIRTENRPMAASSQKWRKGSTAKGQQEVFVSSPPAAMDRSQSWLRGVCVCVQSLSCVFSFWPQGLEPTRLLCPWAFPAQSTGVGGHFLPRGIFQTRDQTWFLRLLHCRWILYRWLTEVTQIYRWGKTQRTTNSKMGQFSYR